LRAGITGQGSLLRVCCEEQGKVSLARAGLAEGNLTVLATHHLAHEHQTESCLISRHL